MSIKQAYGGGEGMPLSSFATFLLTFTSLFGGALWWAHKHQRLPRGYPRTKDLILLAAAGHKAARIVTHDQVTAALRAPFVRYKEGLGKGEVKEEARGSGIRRAVGELLTCPFCAGTWATAALTTGYFLAPEATRAVSTFLAVHLGVDLLNAGWYKKIA